MREHKLTLKEKEAMSEVLGKHRRVQRRGTVCVVVCNVSGVLVMIAIVLILRSLTDSVSGAIVFRCLIIPALCGLITLGCFLETKKDRVLLRQHKSGELVCYSAVIARKVDALLRFYVEGLDTSVRCVDAEHFARARVGDGLFVFRYGKSGYMGYSRKVLSGECSDESDEPEKSGEVGGIRDYELSEGERAVLGGLLEEREQMKGVGVLGYVILGVLFTIFPMGLFFCLGVRNVTVLLILLGAGLFAMICTSVGSAFSLREKRREFGAALEALRSGELAVRVSAVVQTYTSENRSRYVGVDGVKGIVECSVRERSEEIQAGDEIVVLRVGRKDFGYLRRNLNESS
jgi:hypothetical protein